MADLDIDTQVLRDTGSALRLVATEFDGANVRSDVIADAVGDGALADRVRAFAHGWDDRRATMVQGIAFLADAAVGVGDTYDRIDTELAGSLQGED